MSIYVDNVYQGQVRTDGNFNYNIGQLSPGLHTFYTLARQADTGRISKRSNILSEQVSGTQIIEEEFVEDFEPEEVIPEPEDTVVPEESEEVIPEPEDTVVPEEPETEDKISSISEEKEEENNIVIQDEESQDNVNVTETEDHDVEVDVISHEESQDQLVVDSQKSELNEEEKEEDTVTEELQAATPDGELTEMLMGELDVVEKQERNRKVGLWLLVILIVIVLVSTSLSGKKTKFKAEDSEKKDDDSNSHQGDLFNRE